MPSIILRILSGSYSKIVETSNPEGYVVIDDSRFKTAIGGVRLISGVSQKEVSLLAQAMSLKLHSFGLPLSGGKGGVNSELIEDFYRFIAHPDVSSLIQGTDDLQFVTGPDIGTTETQYYEALRRAGMDHIIREGLLSSVSPEYGMPLDNIITAFGVIVVCEELLSFSVARGTDPLVGHSFAIEGFGKVGTGLARLLKNRGKLVAVSTRYGTIVDEEGLDIDRLLELQQVHGDRLVFEYGLEVQSTDTLFAVSVDVLIPGARTEVIVADIAHRIIDAGTPFIVPVSNFPYTQAGLNLLDQAGITAFPDFIASGGAVIAAMVEFASAGGEQEAFDLVHAAISAETKDLLLAIKACGDGSKTLYQLALERAEQRKIDLLASNKVDITTVAKKIVSNYLPHLTKSAP